VEPRPRAESLLRAFAHPSGVDLEPNGFYVPPVDPAALGRAIAYLLEHPEERARLGAAGRKAVEQLMTTDQFASRMRDLVGQACSRVSPSGD
jgi:glycosyltransferase involved in cell wall biosynthesis